MLLHKLSPPEERREHYWQRQLVPEKKRSVPLARSFIKLKIVVVFQRSFHKTDF